MDPQNQEQQQDQPSSGNSSVPPLEDVAAIAEQLKGHGFFDNEISMPLSPRNETPPEPFLKRTIQEDDTDDYYLGRLPKEAYASSPKRTKFYNFFDDPKGENPIIISDTDNDDGDQRMEITENQMPLAFDINAYDINNESDDDNNDDETRRRELIEAQRREAERRELIEGQRREAERRELIEGQRREAQRRELIRRQNMRERQYIKETAKRYAAHIHRVPENKDGDHNVAIVIDDGSPSTPFSEAIKAIQERVEKNRKKGTVDESLIWVPKRNGEDFVNRRFLVPSLEDMSLKVLAEHADAVVSLDGVSDELKLRLSNLLCDSRRMNGHVLELLLRGNPKVIRLKDCSWLTEEEFTKYFGTLNPSGIEVLHLNQCGRVVAEHTLLATVAKSPKCLSKLISLSLTGACRLFDNGLQLLLSSATALRSINLSQCSLLTFSGLNILADSLGSILKELYLDDCILINATLALPALKRLEQLDVLSLAGLPTVSDKFINSFIVARGHNIKELVLKDCVDLTDASIQVIANHCPGLQALDLMKLSKLTDLSIGYLTNSCQALRTLKLCRNPFSDEAIGAFLAVTGKSLEELSLNNIKKVGQHTALSLAKEAKNLHTLDLSWCRNLTDNEFGLIVDNCFSLRFLKLFGCSQVTDVFLKGHSNSELRIIGLKLCPLLQHMERPDPHRSALRYAPLLSQ
ncbi:unnamed protein product [Trifolium pratense]|uniref:Uncharacterized protein n=1 Tax=Trifolium pratense TaxID=57577 RepID=A0ACB0K2H8_TRIPR|nr:unnamed protein product [Trifolium pratense]